MRVEAGKKLVAYMDDRRGGTHLKFVSPVQLVPPSKDNSALFEDGTRTSPVTILTVPVNGFRCS